MKISIIMPLYNAEKYLEECLCSVLEQTFTEFELICIDDASEDSTMQIIQNFQQKDNRIKILSNDRRHGAAFSRNRGMHEAQGKYLAFLDGDDIFDETMLEEAYNKIEEKRADIVMYEFRHVPSEYIHKKLSIYHSVEYKNKYCKDTFSLKDCEAYESVIWSSGAWNKLYKKEFIERNKIFFQDLSCANDVYFVIMALLLADKIIMLETEKIMVYVRDHSEAGRISHDRDPVCSYEALMQIGQELVKRGRFSQLSSCYYYRAYFSLLSALVADRNKERARNYYHFLQRDGIRNICSLDERCYDAAEQYIKEELMQFQYQSFDSGWYQEKNILTLFLYQKADKIIELFERMKSIGKKIAIWGAGQHGGTLLAFCLRHELPVEAIVDNADNKHGEKICGYTIAPPHDVINKVQLIIVSPRFIYDDVVKEIDSDDMEIIDINQFLCLY